jgi:regulatory protein
VADNEAFTEPSNEAARDAEDLAAYSRAKQEALRFISYRSRSQVEVRRRLKNRYSPPVIDQVIDGLLTRGFLNDAAFAQEWRRQRERRRPRDQKLVRQELLQMGVDGDVVREALAGFDDAANAYQAGRSRARRLPDSDFIEFRQKLWAHLQRRGFGHSVIREAIERLWRELADSEDGQVDSEHQEKQGEEPKGEGVNKPANEEGAKHGGSSDPS